MLKKRWFAALSATLMLAACLTGCGEDDKNDKNDTNDKNDAIDNSVSTVYTDKEVGFQLEKPAAGDTVAVMHTTKGDIAIRFFPEAAPKAVENFITHAKNGYYDGLTFHRVSENFMIQGGDPKGDGTGGESIWGKAFEDEFDQKLINLRGSLVMANSGPNTNGSQFFINQTRPNGTTAEQKKSFINLLSQYQNIYNQYKDQYGKQFTQSYPDVFKLMEANGSVPFDYTRVPDAVWDLYDQYGGNIHLDGAWRHGGGHTVFGQVYDGMNVVDAIAMESTDSNDKPMNTVTIKSIEITTYTEAN